MAPLAEQLALAADGFYERGLPSSSPSSLVFFTPMPLPLLSLLLLLLLLLLLFLLLTEQVDFHTPLSSSHFLFAMRTDSLVNPSRAFNSASNLLVCSWVRTSVEGSRMKKKNPLSPEILKKRSAACVRG